MTDPLEGRPVDVGPYRAGEIVEPLLYPFTDANGDPIDLTGYDVRIAYRINRGTQVVRTGTLADAAAGQITYAWVAADLNTVGLMEGDIVVGNGGNRYAQSFRAPILAPLGGAIPTI